MDYPEVPKDVPSENGNQVQVDLILKLENLRAEVAGHDGEWSLTDVMTFLYGFQPDSMDREQQLVNNLKNFEGIEIHDWQIVGNKGKEDLRAILKKKDLRVDETWEGLKLTREWLQELETDLFSLVRCLLMERTKAEKSQFLEFKTELQRLKDSKNGRLPIVVYRSLAALDGLFSRMEEPNDRDFKALVSMISRLESVLSRISSLLISDNNRLLTTECQEVLKESNKTLEEVQADLIGAKLRRKYRKVINGNQNFDFPMFFGLLGEFYFIFNYLDSVSWLMSN